MNIKFWFIVLATLLIFLIIGLIATNSTFISLVNIELANKTNNTTIQNNNQSPTITTLPNKTDQFNIPSNDYIINHINWSKYPNLQTGYVLVAEKSGPTFALDYDFIEVQICTEIKDTDNETRIYEQLSGVAHEAKKLYGPASGVNIHGTIGGASYYSATILPYNDTVII